jgi:hypothetical protein
VVNVYLIAAISAPVLIALGCIDFLRLKYNDGVALACVDLGGVSQVIDRV